MKKKLKVGLLVGEFFATELPYLNNKGGYGILARNYIAQYIPNEDIEVDSIIGVVPEKDILEVTLDGSKKVVFLPKDIYDPLKKEDHSKLGYLIHKAVRAILMPYRYYKRGKIWKNKLNEYDVFISIEFQNIARRVMTITKKTPLLLYIQDPRPQSQWDEIDSVELIKKNEGGRPNKGVAKLMNKLYKQKRLFAISQGVELIDMAKELYNLPDSFTSEFVPNPVISDSSISKQDVENKTNKVLFLGRQDSVKRPWIFAELAKTIPEYEFYMTGQIHEECMHNIMDKYKNIPNLHFVGHIEGEQKHNLLKECKFLVNTSIHEAVPVSFLEAMIYGTLVVSSRYSDGLPSKFGKFVGQINGDGFDSIDLFKQAILELDANQEDRVKLALDGMQYIKDVHNVEKFTNDVRKHLIKTAEYK